MIYGFESEICFIKCNGWRIEKVEDIVYGYIVINLKVVGLRLVFCFFDNLYLFI